MAMDPLQNPDAAPLPVGTPSICVFCGARRGFDPAHAQWARRIGMAIAERRWQLVFGGGSVGLMGEVAQAALDAGGTVIGVIPEALMARELAHRGVTDLRVVADMSIRKQQMVAISDAFIALPGGFGTLDELFEVLTLRQTRYHSKPVRLFDPDGYYDRLISMCEGFVEQGFVSADHLQLVRRERSIEGLLDGLFTAQA
jgi:uncharacterized protein (TIGR00730 family)